MLGGGLGAWLDVATLYGLIREGEYTLLLSALVLRTASLGFTSGEVRV